jgi:hypothetical protein
MAYKLIRLIEEDESSPAMEGVPFPTGVEIEAETGKDRTAVKLLKFIDGTKPLSRLIEDLPLTARQLGETICRLYDLGAIAFDPEYCDGYLVDEPAPVAPATSPAVGAPSIPSAPRDAATSAPHGCPEPGGGAARMDAGDKVTIEIVEEGSLEEIPLWQRFNQLERKLFTGRVVVNASSRRREFYFMNGNLSSAKSEVPQEDIGFMLMEKKKMSQVQYEAYKKELAASGADPFTLLADMGAFPIHQKLMAQRWACQIATFSALGEKSGTFLVEKWDRLPRDIPKLGLNFKGIMARFMAEVLPVDEEAEKLKDKMDWWLVPLAQDVDRTLADKEKRLWDVILERPRRLRDIMVLTTMFKKDTYRFILTLLTGGLVEMVKHPPVEEGPIDLRELDEAFEIMMESNYFDVLTVHPVSDSEDIKKSHERVIKKFNLSSYRELTEDQKTKLLKMKERVEAAWATLHEEGSRRDYRKKTFSDYQMRQYAQLQYQKGEIYLWWRQDAARALEYFRSSMDLDPQSPLYWAACAFCATSSSSSDPRLSSEALVLAEKVASLSSAEPTVLVFAGGTFMRLGRKSAAEAMFDRARKAAGDEASVAPMIDMVMSRQVSG